MDQRSTAVIAVGIFSGLVFCGALIYGLAVFFAVLATIIVTITIGGAFLGLQQKIDLLDSVTGVILFTIGGIFFSILLFVGDCLGGYIKAPTVPFLEACMTHSGIGFPITAGIAILFGGLVIIALIRVALVRLYSYG